ncbi:MAG: TIGR04372 family glycosyltransferase, partial [Candidatus Adiutrix sp.]|nr:TIGR04372 family glycosyltransferase [Candidatus Adiutrix sp.]
WDIFLRPRLCFELECPDCGHIFKIDYYAGAFDENNQTACPKCRKLHLLAAREVLTLFEKQVREESDKINEDDETAKQRLGEIIAHAALLLEPVAMVFVVKFWSCAIGHYVMNTANMLNCLMEIFGYCPLLIAIPPAPEEHANTYLTEQWARQMLITPVAKVAYDYLENLPGHSEPNPAIKLPAPSWGTKWHNPDPSDWSYTVTRVRGYPLPMHARHLINLEESFTKTTYWYHVPLATQMAIPIFKFTDDEHRLARAWLADYGISSDEYVTFLGREDAYYQQLTQVPSHLLQPHRNIDIKTYLPAMQWLADSGMASLRMGSVAAQKLEPVSHSIIDYVNLDRSDFLDIYFFSNSRFTVSCGTGPDVISPLMKKPILLANGAGLTLIVISGAFNIQGNLLSLKLLWDEKKNRALTFREIFSSGADTSHYLKNYTDRGLNPLSHTAEEILAMVQEMHARVVTKTWVVTDDERRLQDKFANLLDEFYPGFPFKASLSYSFYKAHPELLADA